MPFHERTRRHKPSRGRSAPDINSGAEIDPSVFFGRTHSDRPDRKTLQLCRQAERTLSIALAGESGDEVLRDVMVISVTPAPDASRLLVTVCPVVAIGADPARVLEHLQSHKSFLRARVAESIHRKRAPELMFVVGWPEGAP